MSDYNNIFYNSIYNKNDLNYQKVGWGSKKSQLTRFKIFLKHNNFRVNESVLDVGCGTGDFLNFLLKTYNLNKNNYLGIDLNDNFIKLCYKAYPKFSFICGNFLELKLRKKFSYIFVSGLFNLPQDKNNEFIDKFLKKTFKFSTISCTLNFLSTNSKKINKFQSYYAPDKILSLVNGISKNYVFDHSYMEHDFCVTIYK